jgi:hypothetical protein
MPFLGDQHGVSPYAADLPGALAGLRRAAQTSLQRFEQNFSKSIAATLVAATFRSARAVDPEPTCYVMLLGLDRTRALF